MLLYVVMCACTLSAQGRGRNGGRHGASAASSAPTSIGLMHSPFPQAPNSTAAMANYNSYQYAVGMRSPAMRGVGGMQSPMAMEAGYIFNPHVVYQSSFAVDGTTEMHTPSASAAFRVPGTPSGSRTLKKVPAQEIVDLEVSQHLSHNAKRAHNRRLHAEFDEQVRTIQETGGVPVIRLRTNSRGEVCELRTKWHAAIKAMCQRYLRYSVRKFEKQDKRLVNCIIDAITHKMFRYEPYPLAEGAVLQFMQSHMNTARSRYRSYWVQGGCNDHKPHPSMSPGDWAECARFWKSEEGSALSDRMSVVRSCVGRHKDSGQGTEFIDDQNMVCCPHCLMTRGQLNFFAVVSICSLTWGCPPTGCQHWRC